MASMRKEQRLAQQRVPQGQALWAGAVERAELLVWQVRERWVVAALEVWRVMAVAVQGALAQWES